METEHPLVPDAASPSRRFLAYGYKTRYGEVLQINYESRSSWIATSPPSTICMETAGEQGLYAAVLR
jgi:hypothetical protein